ncbi:hypothetical protein LWC35_26760 [Pseudonocardia kujensis]|uniref:hypothetical protein n=1 Tax=Pseudonocardia kujensis TaxID=1128675 RepID=UPI001E595F5C|nr:hypothetical protein [Pseudonocardia kujensis]MCE0766479.1 hypothetical protein [Pseudonocardia kujensis]
MNAARVVRRPVIVLTAAVLGLGAAGGLTGMALGGIGAAVSDRVSDSSGTSPGPVHYWHHHHDQFDDD